MDERRSPAPHTVKLPHQVTLHFQRFALTAWKITWQLLGTEATHKKETEFLPSWFRKQICTFIQYCTTLLKGKQM